MSYIDCLDRLQFGETQQSVIYYCNVQNLHIAILPVIQSEAERRGILCRRLDVIDDLTDVLVEHGRAAKSAGCSICLFRGDLQLLSVAELREICTALHRCNQLRLPIMFFGAGTPAVLKQLGTACEYSERLFHFELY